MPEESKIDCRGAACPQPVIQTRDALQKMVIGAELCVIVDNDGANSNIKRFADSQGHTAYSTLINGNYEIRIRKETETGSATMAESEISCDPRTQQGLAIYLNSEVVGHGDMELGHVLMNAFLDTLTNFAPRVTHIILINSGVKLAVAGSPVLDRLQELEGMGTDILSCGTCLNHYGIQEMIQCGSVSNMYTILEILDGAQKVITP